MRPCNGHTTVIPLPCVSFRQVVGIGPHKSTAGIMSFGMLVDFLCCRLGSTELPYPGFKRGSSSLELRKHDMKLFKLLPCGLLTPSNGLSSLGTVTVLLGGGRSCSQVSHSPRIHLCLLPGIVLDCNLPYVHGNNTTACVGSCKLPTTHLFTSRVECLLVAV